MAAELFNVKRLADLIMQLTPTEMRQLRELLGGQWGEPDSGGAPPQPF